MRINKFVAIASGLSRRAADQVIAIGRVKMNGKPVKVGDLVTDRDQVTLDGKQLTPASMQTIIFNKPVGFVSSRDGQGAKTIYDLLPPDLHHLKPVGRLDKDSSGLLLMTTDGELANQLTHPRYQKTKVYKVELDKPLSATHQELISDHGVQLEDGKSRFELKSLDGDQLMWRVTMTEGRNRQIRRTFSAVGYNVTSLHRTVFGPYKLEDLAQGIYKKL